uniref:7-deoxyloganetic acid glucosyl transferase 3-1 n=1 Tax=Centranthera grandiflora TaxID=2491184 RepID=A0A3G8GC65_9LAMI|nr:7-deoxyloganetic acid glucosyl transferase 3-1 [Centranthera grandiflora]
MFPIPLQGPVNSMLNLAELLCLSGLRVTFLVTDHIHARLQRHSSVGSRFRSYPDFQIRAIQDGLPDDHPRGESFLELFESMGTKTRPLLKEMLSDLQVSCVVVDGILGFACDVADELGVPFFCMRTISAACLWIFFCLPELIESGELPFQDDMGTLIESVPGMETYLRRRDLPSFCRSPDTSDPHIDLYKNERQVNSRARGLILNTFQDLEAPILNRIRSACPNVYTVGPLHAHVKSRLVEAGKTPPATTFSSSLWEEDRSCMRWLDSQPPGSVLYLSFGSLAVVNQDQMAELWHGLVNSGQRFLWVIRPDAISSEIPAKLLDGSRERGYVVGWSPQEEVLAHPAVGGFWTHGGWNSTLEGVWEGVPMMCSPCFLDQQVNSRLVGEVWGLGMVVEDGFDRGSIEGAVVRLMVGKWEELRVRAAEVAMSARRCVSEGGSSFRDLDRLVQDIESSGSCGGAHR